MQNQIQKRANQAKGIVLQKFKKHATAKSAMKNVAKINYPKMKKGYCFYFQEIYLKNLEDEHDEL
jgi:hypothetical protein